MLKKLFSEPTVHRQIYIYAESVNSAYKAHNTNMLNAATELFYTYCYEKGSVHLTKYTKPEEFQYVGQAFAITAIYVDLGNPNAQSIAAENAYYCLTCAVQQGDEHAKQWLFNLLIYGHRLLNDKFTEAFYHIKTDLTDITLSMFITASSINELITETAYYILTLFFDPIVEKPLIKKTIIEYQLDDALGLMRVIGKQNHNIAVSIGKQIHNKVFTAVERTVKNY